MLDYEIITILTNPIFTFTIQKFFRLFFGENVYSKKIEKLSYLIYFIFFSILGLLTRIPIITLICTLASFFFISLNYISSMQKKIIFTFLIYSILLIIELIIAMTIGFFDIFIYRNSSFHSSAGLILIRTTTMIVAFLMEKYLKSKRKDFSIPTIYYFAFIAILVGSLYLYIASLENHAITFNHVIAGGVVLILINVTMVIIDEKIYHAIIVENEKNILKQQNCAYEKQAEIIRQSMESIKSLKHDIKNHLLILYEMNLSEKKVEIKPYIDNILEQMNDELLVNTQNFVVDSLINLKLGQLENTGTKINLDILIPQEIQILSYDITVILGNLLDNAVVAIKQSENKKLNLRISCVKGNLIILIENSFNGNIIKRNDKFLTTKSFPYNHGLGLSNIEKSLLNYGGDYTIQYSKDLFSVSVVIPLHK